MPMLRRTFEMNFQNYRKYRILQIASGLLMRTWSGKFKSLALHRIFSNPLTAPL